MNNSLKSTLKSIGVIILGGSGYGAKEFLRLAILHPELEIASIISSTNSGELVSKIHKELNSLCNLKFSKTVDLDVLAQFAHKFIVLALPHEESEKFVINNFQELQTKQICILDLSGAFRLKNKTERSNYYGPIVKELTEEIINSFEYGLTEINSDKIKSATNISNPGCFATGAILSIHPLKSLNILNIAIDGKSGSSGAGRGLKQNFHHPELSGSSFPYAVLKHRHSAEIIEYCIENKKINLAFTPHVIPISRGMLISSYVFLSESKSKQEIIELYTNTYKNCPFIRLVQDPSEIRLVAGSNFCDIYIEVKDNIICVTAALDNLIKGMAGQAIQNINLKCGLPESMGLNHSGLGLV